MGLALRAAEAAAVGAGFLPGKCSFCLVVDKAANHILTYEGEGKSHREQVGDFPSQQSA